MTSNERTSRDVDAELAAMEVRARDLLAERARLRTAEVERSHRDLMRMLESWLCRHDARTRFVGCGGRAFWICDACETVVGPADPEPAPSASVVVVNVADPIQVDELLRRPEGEAAILRALTRFGARTGITGVDLARPGDDRTVSSPPPPATGGVVTEPPPLWTGGPSGTELLVPAPPERGRTVADCTAKFGNAGGFSAEPAFHQLGADPAADAELAREFQLPAAPPAPPPVGRSVDDTPF